MARLAAAVLACGLLFATAVRKDVAGLQKEDSDVSKVGATKPQYSKILIFFVRRSC